MNNTSTPLLIIGAGPTGLSMAAYLTRLGISYRIIEKNKSPSIHSKALGVQARTLEIFDWLGIADKATQQGFPVQNLAPHFGGKRVFTLRMDNLGQGESPFPYVLILEQNKTEKILIEYLEENGQNIEWGTELLSLQQNETGVQARIKTPKGEETITADWLIGADGARSPVRHELDLPFEGGTYEHLFLLADAKLTGEFDNTSICIYTKENSFIGIFPMTGDQRTRIIGIVPEKLKNKPDLNFEDVRDYFENDFDLNIKLTDSRWFSVYKLHHRCVNQFRSGRCFLAGDSAHIHSPAGGQGMNTGIQDAWNLAWKLALVVKGKAPEKLLDTYNEERLPNARLLLKTTDRLFEGIVNSTWSGRMVRQYVFPHLMGFVTKFRPLRLRIFRMFSQTGIHYAKSSLNESTGSFSRKAPRPGNRTPMVYFRLPEQEQPVHVFDLMSQPGFQVLSFADQQDTIQLREHLQGNFSGLFHVHHIPKENNQAAYRQYGIRKTGLFLVRPDGHICYRSQDIDVVKIVRFLKEKIGLHI